MNQIVQLTLMYREDCHLCDMMLQELVPYLKNEYVQLERIDIDEHPQFLADYNDLVPVLLVDDEALCKYRLNKGRLDQVLSESSI